MKAICTAILTLALALATSAAHAQGFYYQSLMPDGRIVIGDKPAPGAKEVKKMPLTAGNVSAPLATPAPPDAAGQQAAQDSADAVRQAQQQLQSAKTALESGREPLPGERIGTAGGASRLTDTYHQRQKSLEDAVTAAQKRLDEASSRTGR